MRRSKARRIARTSAVLFGLAGLPGPATAAEPPPCNSEEVMRTVRSQYETAERMTDAPQHLLEVVEAHETALGAPPASANQYATADMYVALSRYCEGQAALRSGEREPLYWRIDIVRNGTDEYTQTEHCSLRHDVFENQCRWARSDAAPDGAASLPTRAPGGLSEEGVARAFAGDGQIAWGEAAAMLTAMLTEMDDNGDGGIAPEEYAGEPATFSDLDADGDGRLALVEYLQWHRLRFQKADTDTDDRVSLDAFMQAMPAPPQ